MSPLQASRIPAAWGGWVFGDGCDAEVSGQSRSNQRVNLCGTRGIWFLQNSMYKTSFHRQKIRVTEQTGLGYLGFFSKSSLRRWAFWAGKLCHAWPEAFCISAAYTEFIWGLKGKNCPLCSVDVGRDTSFHISLDPSSRREVGAFLPPPPCLRS